MECSNVSRRGFLKAGFGLGAVATASGLALNLTKGEAHAAGPVPKKWDETYDVVVIGSGFAGLSAAIEAKNAGSTVIVLEKCLFMAETPSSTVEISALPAQRCKKRPE